MEFLFQCGLSSLKYSYLEMYYLVRENADVFTPIWLNIAIYFINTSFLKLLCWN